MKQTLTAKDLDNSRKRYLSNLKKLDAKLALYPELVELLDEAAGMLDGECDGCGDDDPLPCLWCRMMAAYAKAEAIERGEA